MFWLRLVLCFPWCGVGGGKSDGGESLGRGRVKRCEVGVGSMKRFFWRENGRNLWMFRFLKSFCSRSGVCLWGEVGLWPEGFYVRSGVSWLGAILVEKRKKKGGGVKVFLEG